MVLPLLRQARYRAAMTLEGRRSSASAPAARQAARNERWMLNFNESREARGLTHDQIARAVGVSTGAVRKWGQGESRPTLDKAIRLADVLDVARVRVLDWAGFVPGVADLTLYVEQLQQQLSAWEESRVRVPVGGVRGVGHLAHALALNGRYVFKVVPWWRGTGRHARHFADWIVIEDGIGPLTREAVESEVHEAFQYTASYWNGGEDWSHVMSPPIPELVICTPRFDDMRRGSGVPTGSAPRSIAVMGQHWCGHAEVARFIAEALNYDYASDGFVAATVYGSAPHNWSAPGWRRDRREVVRTYALDAELGRSRVWAANIWEDVDSLEIALGQPRFPFIVYLRPSDDVIEYSARMRVACNMTSVDKETDAEHIRVIRAAAQALLAEAEAVRPTTGSPRSLTFDVDMPTGTHDWSDHPPYAVDAWFARYAEIAATALKRLARSGSAMDREAAFDLQGALEAAGL